MFRNLGLLLIGALTAADVNAATALSALRFERNVGQTASSAAYLARGRGYSLHLEPARASFGLRGGTVRLELLGASKKATMSGESALVAKANYFVGSPAHWRSDVPLFAAVRARQVYDGIDVVYYGRDGQLEYDFIVAPGADPAKIRMRFEGASRPVVGRDGELRITSDASLIQRPPVLYQGHDGLRTAVEGGYVVDRNGGVGFKVGAYDRTQPLVIDPVLVYSTLLGGTGEDSATAVAVDADGNAYVTGFTNSTDLPVTEGAYGPSYTDYHPDYDFPDVFVAKFDPTGAQLLYLTYLGGSTDDFGYAIEVDAAGNAYVAGDGAVPTTPGAHNLGGAGGGFIAKLSSDGGSLLYSAIVSSSAVGDLHLAGDGSVYFAGGKLIGRLSADGSQLEASRALDLAGGAGQIEVDALGNVYVAGLSQGGSGFVATPGAFDETYNGGVYDAFLMKFDATLTDPVYATFLGSANEDYLNSLVVDAAGNAYAGGEAGFGFPTTPGAFRTIHGGLWDGFVAKFNADGSLAWSTLVNGEHDGFSDYYEAVHDLALTPAGLIYVAGDCDSRAPFPVTPGAFGESPYGIRGDGFLLLLAAEGTGAVYASYLSGSGGDFAQGLAVDATGGAFIVGKTTTTNGTAFPTTEGAFDRTHNDPAEATYAGDAFVVRLLPLVDSAAGFLTSLVETAQDATSAVIDVARSGSADGEFSVDYTVTAGDAVLATGSVTWPDGNSATQQVEVPVAVAPVGAKSTTTQVRLSQPNGRLGQVRQLSVVAGGSDKGGSGGSPGVGSLLLLAAAALARCRKIAQWPPNISTS